MKEGRVVKPTKIKNTKCQQREKERYCLKVVLPSNIYIYIFKKPPNNLSDWKVVPSNPRKNTLKL